ncbi:MAG TPA: FecR family protein [Thermoguttaceae bacterium]|nr:FecR family protein [Thermoguttaceae bacterium]
MNGNMPEEIPEENVGRLIASSVGEREPDFQPKLVAAVLEEVRGQRARIRAGRVRKTRWALLATAAAALVIAIALWSTRSGVDQQEGFVARGPKSPPGAGAIEQVGQVRRLHGLVLLENGQSPRQVDQIEYLRAGQWVETYSRSEAAILLPDESRLSVRPRSRVQIADETHGARLVVERGGLRVDAAKQPPGNSLTIETPGARITVLGTRLDVHVVERLDGRKQTRVSVLSGEVELESAGRKIVLLPNMEGVADQGERPLARSLTAEVNEMIRLVDETQVLAAESDVPAGRPSIVEFHGDGSATIWTILPVRNSSKTDRTSYTLPSGMSASVTEAYTLDGARLPVASSDDGRAIDMSIAPVPPGAEAALIVKLAGVPDVFQDRGSGAYELALPATGSGVLSLVQLRLPASARIEQLEPAPIETRQTLSRLVLTVAVDGRLADVVP